MTYNSFINSWVEVTCIVRRLGLVVAGLGNVGKLFLKQLIHRGRVIEERFDVKLSVRGVIDSSGYAFSEEGLSVKMVVELKDAGESASSYPGFGKPYEFDEIVEFIREGDFQVLIEATSTNVVDEEPGLTFMKTALNSGKSVITTDKGPLVLSYSHLIDLARRRWVSLRFSGTVGGGMPVLGLGRELSQDEIIRVEAILNSTSNYVLILIAEEKVSMNEGIKVEPKAISRREKICVDGLLNAVAYHTKQWSTYVNRSS